MTEFPLLKSASAPKRVGFSWVGRAPVKTIENTITVRIKIDATASANSRFSLKEVITALIGAVNSAVTVCIKEVVGIGFVNPTRTFTGESVWIK